ncbi:DinB family protein [Actinocrinis puniceicyclus]|uniref:DinB family protein n=1 Tax=Actinocrinis puniceicyclus TaxID=977794 RepID=A0A8J7WPA0_9ACTN|nr:DinB family protein [Actinocrinis puniceicyclus]MBS2964355.1 DinB family protein [Actinocrinis puniceicyclus]
MTITMDAQSRVEPPTVADERTLLNGFLDYHRDTLAWKCSGLSDEQLKLRSVEPSGMSLLGMLRHLTEVERGWFGGVIGGEEMPPLYYDDADQDGDWNRLDSLGATEVFEAWQAACARSREIAAARELDFEGTHRRGGSFSLRWVLLHMIEEYARHNGHADLLRERIDGGALGE